MVCTSVPMDNPRKSEEEVERTHESQPGQKCSPSHGKGESLHSGMDWLLLCGRHETDLAKLERMVAKTTADVHLETVEKAANKSTKPAEAGDTGMAGLPVGQFPSRVLAHRRKSSVVSFYNKQKARTGRIL